ncbi:putative mannan endo-1,4-beta-mannosidase [Helianthus annuus]|nr:putative mannan endo-1,4-beta-mannosidase [Helianthus annuus]
MHSHIEDGERELKKPVMFTEFGLSDLNKGFDPAQRDEFYKIVFDVIYESAKKKGAGGGSFAWQFLVEGMEEFNDDFGIVPWKRASTYSIITRHTCRLAKIHGGVTPITGNLKNICNGRW